MGTRRVDRETVAEIQDFLYREALALDERRFRDWLDLLTDDMTYEVPVRVTVPSAYGGPGQWVAEFSRALAETVPPAPDPPTGCRG